MHIQPVADPTVREYLRSSGLSPLSRTDSFDTLAGLSKPDFLSALRLGYLMREGLCAAQSDFVGAGIPLSTVTVAKAKHLVRNPQLYFGPAAETRDISETVHLGSRSGTDSAYLIRNCYLDEDLSDGAKIVGILILERRGRDKSADQAIVLARYQNVRRDELH